MCLRICVFFFFNNTATTEIYPLSLPDALPISTASPKSTTTSFLSALRKIMLPGLMILDRKSTRLNSSHTVISYAVFCLKKKQKDYGNAFLRETLRDSPSFLTLGTWRVVAASLL